MPIFSQFGEIVWQRLFKIARILQTTALKSGRLFEFQHFQQVYYVYFATKQVVITKREDVTNLGFCKYSNENSVFGKSLISSNSIFLWGRRGRGVGCGWVLINFFCLQDGRLFGVGANSRLKLIRINTVPSTDKGYPFLTPSLEQCISFNL